jgi:hypothetical protein
VLLQVTLQSPLQPFLHPKQVLEQPVVQVSLQLPPQVPLQPLEQPPVQATPQVLHPVGLYGLVPLASTITSEVA